MKLDRTKYFIRGNEKYPELIRQFFKGYKYRYNDIGYYLKGSRYFFFIKQGKILLSNDKNYLIKSRNLTELKLTDLAIKNDLGEEYAPKMKEFFEKLGCDVKEYDFTNKNYTSCIQNIVVWCYEKDVSNFNKVPILLSDWLGMEEPKEKTESLTAFEAEVLEKTKRRTFKIESFKNKITKEQQHIFIPYQLCPKCNGQGIVSISPLVAGDVSLSTGSSSQYTCNVCNGQKIIPMYFKQ